MTIRVAFAAQKDFANQIFPSQLFANQNDGVRQTLFATMTAQLLARLCLLNTSRQPADKYVNLGTFNCGLNCGAGLATDNVSFHTNILRAGVNYKF